ncbi:hypothetical protein K439DRAFT_1620693 [Ramaria rubella]|nr:hypothetical protein K439DRAFT_1620693 [Ramaria rubella]
MYPPIPPRNFYGFAAPPPAPPPPSPTTSHPPFGDFALIPQLWDTTTTDSNTLFNPSGKPNSTITEMTNRSNIPSNAATKAASPPASQPVKAKAKAAQKPHEEFSTHDLNQLLHAVIEVDPYMAPHNKVGERWKEIMKRVQDAGYCLGRDHETLKNKVASLLTWVEGGKPRKAQAPLGRDAEENEVLAVSLSGKLDSVAAKKLQVKETKEADKASKAKAQGAEKEAGERMCKAMMRGLDRSRTPSITDSSLGVGSQAGVKSKHGKTDSTGDMSDKENKSDTGVSSCPQSKRARVSKGVTHRDSQPELTKILGFLEKQEQWHAKGMQEHHRANDIHERTSVALIDILHVFVQGAAP